MIPLAIDARRQAYPDETAFEYQGVYLGDARWSAKTRQEISRDGEEYWRGNVTL
eukprot:COSAG05_NODE_10847_length_542_cov_1.514673_1_plen_54_part_00